MAPGVEIRTVVSSFGLLPSTPHTFRIVSVDGDKMQIDTRESGVSIQAWNHSMKVQPISETRCRYEDRIELQAGLLTPVVWAFASLFYRYRQSRWRQLVASLQENT
jgi:hypothetical protein